jgi:hypothetical protein
LVQAIVSYRLLHKGQRLVIKTNPASCFVWVSNLVSDIKPSTSVVGAVEYGARRYVGLRRSKYQETGENRIVRSFSMCG